MPLAQIDGITLELPLLFNAGDIIDDDGAWALNEMMLTRLRERTRWRLRQGVVTTITVQSVVEEMVSAFTFDSGEPCDVDEPVMEEAITLAREMITKSLAKDGLPPPKNLEEHAKTLAEQSDQLRERARLRVEARLNAALAALSAQE